jgi:hypothetical protein
MISARGAVVSACVVISRHAIGNPAAARQRRLFVALLRIAGGRVARSVRIWAAAGLQLPSS